MEMEGIRNIQQFKNNDSVTQKKEQPEPSVLQKITGDNSEYISKKQEESTSGDVEDMKYNSVMQKKAIENANNRMRGMRTSAKFEYNEDIDRITVKIQDKDSKEIIREIPSEDTQKMLEHIHTLRGLLMDQEI